MRTCASERDVDRRAVQCGDGVCGGHDLRARLHHLSYALALCAPSSDVQLGVEVRDAHRSERPEYHVRHLTVRVEEDEGRADGIRKSTASVAWVSAMLG